MLGSHIARLAYAIDVNPDVAKSVAKDFGCASATSLEEVLLKDGGNIDAVIIASTTDTHYALCKAALVADKAVFTEKPISHNPTEVADIIHL